MEKHLIAAAAAAIVTLAAGQALAAPSFTASYSTATVNAGVDASLVFTITGNGADGSLTDGFTYTFQSALSGGTAVVGPGCALGTTAVVVLQTLTVTLMNTTGNNACTITVPVSSTTPGSYAIVATSLASGPALAGGANPNLAVLPTITSLAPATGPTTGGTSVVITGIGFANVAGAASVKFGANNAASYVVDSNTQITAVSPAGAGAVDVSVVAGGQTNANTAADNFSYAASMPTLSEWAMILFGSVLVGAAVMMLNRRRLRFA